MNGRCLRPWCAVRFGPVVRGSWFHCMRRLLLQWNHYIGSNDLCVSVLCYQSFFVYFDMTFMWLPAGQSIFYISSLTKCLVIPGNLFSSYKCRGCHASALGFSSHNLLQHFVYSAGSHSLIRIYTMDWSPSISTSGSSSSSGTRSAVCVSQVCSSRQSLSRVSEAAPLMLSSFPPPRSYGSLLTYYRFIRNGSVAGNIQVLHVAHVVSSLSHEPIRSMKLLPFVEVD